jgi:hypothetical protein
MGAILFAAALGVAIGIASRLITLAQTNSPVTRSRTSAENGVTAAPHRDQEIQNDFYLIKRE